MRKTVSARRSSPDFERLEGRRLLAASLSNIPDQTLPLGKSLYVPIGGERYARSDNPNIWVDDAFSFGELASFTFAGYGKMTFELFTRQAPETVTRFRGLIDSGYFDGKSVFKVSRSGGGGLIQAGSVAAPSGISGYDDEFDPSSIFTGDGQLAALNARGKDSAGNAFFITKGAQRPLDFNYTIFGQLVDGFDVRDAIARAATQSNGAPRQPIVISRADSTGVSNFRSTIRLYSQNGFAGQARINVYESGSDTPSRHFNVNVVADTTNDPPILTYVPEDKITTRNRAIAFNLNSYDAEGDDVTYAAVLTDSTGTRPNLNARASVTLVGRKVTVTPRDDYLGPLYVLVGVAQKGSTTRGNVTDSPYDAQVVTIGVGDKPITDVYNDSVHVLRGGGETVSVANFNSADPSLPADYYSALIDWGDGTSSSGRVVKNKDATFGLFSVVGDLAAQPRLGERFCRVTVTGRKGYVRTFETRLVVNDSAAIAGHLAYPDLPNLVVNGTDGPDVIRVSLVGDQMAIDVNGVKSTIAIADNPSALHPGVVSFASIFAYAGDDKITVDPNVPGVYIDCGPGRDLAIGGNGDDAIIGGSGKDTLSGGNGNDRLQGLSGSDRLYGGNGNDRLYGDDNEDFLDGGNGVDRLYGGTGNDSLYGGASNDKLYGEAGDDYLDGGAGVDYVLDSLGHNTRGDDDIIFVPPPD